MLFGREICAMACGNMALERATKEEVALGDAPGFSKQVFCVAAEGKREPLYSGIRHRGFAVGWSGRKGG